MVQEENGILRASPRIHQNASNSKVPSSVETNGTLSIVIKAIKISSTLVEHSYDICRLGDVGPLRMEVSREAARVVA